jgi:hypothetical protein
MIEYRVAQGTPEWKKARAGVITASNFSLIRAKVGVLTQQQSTYVQAILAGKSEDDAKALAKYKTKPSAQGIDRALAGLPVGEWSDVARNYAFALAIERISGEPLDEGYTGWAAQRGHELEPEARAAHEAMAFDMVEEVGFITTDDGWFGASADGFRCGRKVGAEYKCFLDPQKLRAILLEGDTSSVTEQCMGGMWLSGALAWEFGLYCPALKSIGRAMTLHTIERDDDYIEAMEQDLLEFRGLVMEYEAQLRQAPDIKTAAPPAAEAPPWTDKPAPTKAAPVAMPANLFA